MQSLSPRIWTRVAVSISYDDNQYTTSTSLLESSMGKILLLQSFYKNGFGIK